MVTKKNFIAAFSMQSQDYSECSLVVGFKITFTNKVIFQIHASLNIVSRASKNNLYWMLF